MGERVPLTRDDTGATIGTAMVINTNDPVKEFAALAKVDGVLVGLVITDEEMLRKIRGDVAAFSIAPKTKAQVNAEFEAHLLKVIRDSDGRFVARGMQEELHG